MDHLTNKTIAIHQPNYLPWPGYFYKISRCDEFVFLDHVQINKRGLTRRTQLPDRNHPGQTIFLTVPLRKFSDSTPINALFIDHTKNWQTQHLNKIRDYYQRFPYFEAYYNLFEKWLNYSIQYEKLSELNIYLIKEICTLLGIRSRWHLSSNMPITTHKNEMNAQIVHLLGGRTYLSGEGAVKNYQDVLIFKNAGIDVRHSEYLGLLHSKPYSRYPAAGRSGIFDILFTIGVDGAREYIMPDDK